MKKLAKKAKKDVAEKSLELAKKAGSLSKVLDQSKYVNILVKESADELASVNSEIKQDLANRDIPTIVASVIEKSEAVESKVQEASDKLTTVNQALEVEIRDRIVVDTELALAIEQKQIAQDAALHDALTGLPTRALFNDRLEHGIAQTKRHGGHLAVFFIDLDSFKGINDTHGHDAGDIVLQTVAYRLKEHLREEDTVSRYGGDEFLCVLTEVQNESSISVIVEKIISGMQAPCYVKAGEKKVKVNIGASIGIAIFPKDGTTVEMLIKRADEAMYRAKKTQAKYLFA